MNSLLMNETELRKRIYKVHSNMTARAKPKLWKKGKRKGQVRVPGLDSLPFTREELWHFALGAVGTGVIRCPYCEAIGRPVNLIDLTNCVFDHKSPVKRAGQELTLLETWSLKNIAVCCADCNNTKGDASYDFFIALMAAIEQWDDPRDRTYAHACLRTHGIVLQGFRDDDDAKKKSAAAPDVPTTGTLALRAPREDW